MSNKKPTVIMSLVQYEPNEKYDNMIRELLQIEEKLNRFQLTAYERRQFQNYVKDRLGEVWLLEKSI